MSSKNIIVDTAYLLPVFGIKVEGIDPDILFKLHESNIELYYPKLIIVELVSKIAKECVKSGMRKIPGEALEALNALLLEVDVKLLEPKVEHLEKAIRLRILGHRDMFDNILYATAYHEKAYLLMRDEDFIKFLRKHRLPTDFIVDHYSVNEVLKGET